MLTGDANVACVSAGDEPHHTIQKRETEKVITLLSASHILRNYPTTAARTPLHRPILCALRSCVKHFFFFVLGVFVWFFVVC